MKQKLVSSILLIAISLLALVSCGSGAAKYRNDVAVPDLCAAADPLIGDSSTMATMTDDYLYGMMGIELDGISDYAVKVQASGANVDEYGIFKASSEENVATVEQMVQSYLAKRVETWMPEYMPEEFPKVQSAKAQVYGQYVVYCILDDSEKSAVFNAIEAALKDE